MNDWTPVSQLTNPVRWIFRVTAPGLISKITIDMELPDGLPSAGLCSQMGMIWFKAAIAPAMSSDVQLIMLETTAPRTPEGSWIAAGDLARGMVAASAQGPDDCAVLVWGTGHSDRWGKRRMYVPGTPASWVTDGRLNREGQGRYQTLARAMILAGAGLIYASPAQMLVIRPGRTADDRNGPAELSFRPIDRCRVCEHTGRPPEGV